MKQVNEATDSSDRAAAPSKRNALYLEGGWEVKESLAMNECLRTATCSDKHIVNPPFRVGGWETEVEKLAKCRASWCDFCFPIPLTMPTPKVTEACAGRLHTKESGTMFDQ